MTNLPSGSSKRSWEVGETGDDHHHHGGKRHRSVTQKDEPKDWKDVHLKSTTSGPCSSHSSSHDDGYGRRRSPDGYRRRTRSREHGSRRDERDRDRDRERTRDKERDRDRYRRDRHRDESRKDDRSAPRSVSPARVNGNSHQPLVAVVPMDDEKEEGEISPRPSPVPASRSRRSPSTRPSPASTRSFSEVPPARPVSQPLKVSVSRSAAPQPKDVELELELSNSPPPVEDLLAQRRAKRQAIRAKYTESNAPSAAPSAGVSPGPSTPASAAHVSTPQTQVDGIAPKLVEPGIEKRGVNNMQKGDARDSMSTSPPPPSGFTNANATDTVMDVDGQESTVDGLFELAKGSAGDNGQTISEQGAEQMMAADYDPSKDRREDEQRRFLNGAVANGKAENKAIEVIDEEEEVEEEEEEDDLEDMFAVASDAKPKKTKVKKIKKVSKPAPALITTNQLLDTASDAEGYYNIILGEQLDGGRYQVFSSLGKGMFANVVRARVLLPPPEGDTGTEVGREVAIKIVRSQESMYRAGQKEGQILNKLKQADPEDKKHIVRLERTFEHRGHLCLVFESLSMNLRDVVKRFGKDVGINIRAVRAYAHQLFLALSLLKKLNVMHADIKPDNILVNEQKTMLKLCDLGSASDASENDITPYLVSRFYRAPEIILGIPYDPALDVWSIGCTLYELFTGKILFPGRTNNHMLLLMMELKGRFNAKMLKKASFHDVYFDDRGGFISVEKDKVTGNDVVRTVHISTPTRDLRSRLIPPASVKMKDEESKLLTSFVDLLEKCLMLDPARRITPREALAHPFIKG